MVLFSIRYQFGHPTGNREAQGVVSLPLVLLILGQLNVLLQICYIVFQLEVWFFKKFLGKLPNGHFLLSFEGARNGRVVEVIAKMLHSLELSIFLSKQLSTQL